eukprot:125641-Hanusia_phi.AAC.1
MSRLLHTPGSCEPGPQPRAAPRNMVTVLPYTGAVPRSAAAPVRSVPPRVMRPRLYPMISLATWAAPGAQRRGTGLSDFDIESGALGNSGTIIYGRTQWS